MGHSCKIGNAYFTVTLKKLNPNLLRKVQFGLLWSALVCLGLPWSTLICLGLLGLFQNTIERLKCSKAISGRMGLDLDGMGWKSL